MAEIHAIQDGNWADASTWDLNRVPDTNDDVHIGNFLITCPANVSFHYLYFDGSGGVTNNISNVNGSCVYVTALSSRNNNYAFKTVNSIFSSDIYIDCIGEWVMQNTATINGNMIAYHGTILNSGWISTGKIFNGNISLYNDGQFNSGLNNSGTYNGNIYMDESCTKPFSAESGTHSAGYTLVFNGNIELNSLQPLCGIRKIEFYGKVKAKVLFYRWVVSDPIVFNDDVEIEEFLPENVQFTIGPTNTAHFEKNVTVSSQRGYLFPFYDVTFSQNSVFMNKDVNDIISASEFVYKQIVPQEQNVANGVQYGMQNEYEGRLQLPAESTVLKDVEYGDKVGTLEVIALTGATATADSIAVVNLTEQQLQRVGNCATVSTVQKCFEDFKE
jgi:hypothetical protein